MDYARMWDAYQSVGHILFEGAIPRFRFLVRYIRRHCPRNSAVLDIGFGDATLLRMLDDLGFRCAGIDFAPKNIERTTNELRVECRNGIELKHADISNIPFPDQSFDVIVATEVLEHLDDETIVRGLQEIRRCLKAGGQFVATVPYREPLEEDSISCPKCGATFHRWGHRRSFDEKTLRALLTDAGFTITRITGIAFSPGTSNVFGIVSHYTRVLTRKHKNLLAIARR